MVDVDTLSHTTWDCKYHIAAIAEVAQVSSLAVAGHMAVEPGASSRAPG
jgi:hypothetical protein